MGLDLVDITYRIEKEFGIELPFDELVELARDQDIMVGDLYDLILKKTHLRDFARNDIRLNFALWASVQRLVHSVTDVPLESVELKTPLASLFPRKTRRANWEALREVCPYTIRKLDYQKAVSIAGFWLAVGMVLVEQFQVWRIPGALWLWPVLGILGLWMFVETHAKVLSLAARLRTRFPSGMKTVKDLCRAVLAVNYEEFCRDVEIPFDENCTQTWQKLTKILVDALGVDADEITFRTGLVRDLGAT